MLPFNDGWGRAMFESEIADYYRFTFTKHGATAKGVDWKDEESQTIRFTRIISLLPQFGRPFSVLDVGCGTAALYPLLRSLYGDEVIYTGLDLVPEMIDYCQNSYPKCDFLLGAPESVNTTFDCVISSGIFNVRQNANDHDWHEFMMQTISRMWGLSRAACIFNVLTSHVDFRVEHLHYSDPGLVLAECVRRFTRHFKLDHAYPQYEYTLALYRHPDLR